MIERAYTHLSRHQLRPMLRRLHAEMGEAALNLIEVDAAQRRGVFSLPTTFILDRNSQPLMVYNGGLEARTDAEERWIVPSGGRASVRRSMINPACASASVMASSGRR